jgi:hypothetical protein
MAPGATVKMDHTILTYLNFTGSLPYTVNNCMDGGGNVGLTFGNAGKTYYWVNGAGDWNDLLHWDTVSGGPGNRACVPLMGDSVIFDQNSGFLSDGATVTVSSSAYCKTMIWRGMTYNFPNLEINSILNIYGALEWQENMTVNIAANNASRIAFLSPDTVTITSNNVVINGIYLSNGGQKVEFNSQSGKWIMTDDFQVQGGVLFTDGDIDMSDINVSMGGFMSNNNNTRRLNISNSSIRVTNYVYSGTQVTWNYSGSNGTLLSAGSGLYIAAPGNYEFISVTSLSYSKIVFETNGRIYNTTTDTLILKENGGITLNINTGTTVMKHFESLNCYNFNILGKINNASLNMGADATVNVNHLNINAISIVGNGVPYKAYRSINPSNSAGWDISEGTDVYWVGGAGNWSDANHWANSPGGIPGSGCIPMPGDNVIFDELSGFHGQSSRIVNVNTTAYCKNMTWHNMDALDKPTMTVGNTLNIYGSLELQQGMTVNGNYNIYFMSDDYITIKTNGVYTPIYMYFNGTGTYKILDNINLGARTLYLQYGGRLYMDGISAAIGTLTFTNGSIDMSNSTVSIGTFTGTGSTARTLDIRHSTITVTGAWNYSGSNHTLLADASRINMNSTGAFTGVSVHTYDTLVYMRKGTIASGTVLNTLIFAQGFDGTNATFAFPANGTVTINNKIVTGGTPCDMVNFTSTVAGTKASINVPANAYNIDPVTPVGFNMNFVRIRDLHVLEGDGQAKIRLSNQSYESAIGTNTGGWIIVPYEGLKGVTLGKDTSMWCNATFPLNTDKFYGDQNTTYLWSDKSTENNLVITDYGDYWVQVNYSATCYTSDTIHVSRDNDIQLAGTASPSGSHAKIRLSTSGISSFDPNPVFVLDSVQPAGAMTGLPLAQNSPECYLTVPVRAFFSHTDGLSGCTAVCEVQTSLVAVNDTSFMRDDTLATVPLLNNDIYFLEDGFCTSVSTVLSDRVTAQHGTVQLLNDTLRYMPDTGWTGLDSVHYVLIACNERDTATVYFVTVRDTFDACPDVTVAMTLPDIPGMNYLWYDPDGAVVSTSNSHTVVKDGVDDKSVWRIESSWNGFSTPALLIYLENGSPSTATHISGFSGDVLIPAGISTTLTAHAVAEVVNPVFYWYGEASGGTPFYVGDAYTTSLLTQDTTFYIAVSGDNFCTSIERKPVTVYVILPPVLHDDHYSTLVNTPVVCNLLSNDEIPPECDSPDIDFVTYPANGTVDIVNGEIVYTPAAGYYGVVEGQYAVRCGLVVSNTVSFTVTVSNPLSQTYYACPSATVTLGFKPVPNVVYKWYNAQTAGSLLTSASNTTIIVTKDNSNATQTYWAEPVYNGVAYPRIAVELHPGNCGIIDPTGCAADGTVIFKEDFGGNDNISPNISLTGIGNRSEYGYVSTLSPHNGGNNIYTISKYVTTAMGLNSAWHNIFDHTSADVNLGYCMFVNGDTKKKTYELEINGLCPGIPLYFSLWMANIVKSPLNLVKPDLEFVLFDKLTGDTISIYRTGTTINEEASLIWRMYGFNFTAPSGVTDIVFRIYSYGNGGGGNDYVIDDIEVRFCAPPVVLNRPDKTDTTACIGEEFTLEGTYTDNGTFGGELVSRWEYSSTGNVNNPSEWSIIAGTERVSSSGVITGDYTVSSASVSDAGYYRMSAANSANIDNYNCRAMSDVVHLQVGQCNGAPLTQPDERSFCVTSDSKTKTVNVLKNDEDPDGDDIYLTGADFADAADAALADISFNAADSTVSLKVKPDVHIGVGGHTFEIVYTIRDDASHNADGTLTVTAYPTPNYSDIRVRICPDAGDVNLAKYVDTTGIISDIQWAHQISGVPVSSPAGLISSNIYAPSRIHTLTYTVSSRCVVEQKRKVYLEILRNGQVRLPKHPTVICYEYAEAVNISHILAIEAKGSWSYDANIEDHVTVSTSPIHNGATVMNGKALYNDDDIPFTVYNGSKAKIVTFTYTTDSDSCLEGKSYEIMIVLTEEL